MDRLGIERLCVFGMAPVAFVELAADLDCRFIGIGSAQMRGYNPHGYAPWSFNDDPALRRDTRAAMRDHGVSISLYEGFGVRPDADVKSLAAELDVAAELEVARINIVSIDKDRGRTFDQFAVFAEMARARGIETVTEIGSGPVRTLAAGMDALRHVGNAHFKLAIDTMHFVRFGGKASELAAAPPEVFGYVQLCDAPLVSKHESYMDEALHERLSPGEGELPLRDLLAALPRSLIVSVEVPQRSRAEAGISPRERVRACVRAARALLRQID